MKISKSLFFFLFLFNIININGQLTYKKLTENYKKKEFNKKKADSILSSLPDKDSLYAKTSHNISFYFYKKKKNYDLAIKYGKIETSLLEKLNINNKAYANALYNLGNFHLIKGDYSNSIKYFLKAIKSNASPLKTAQSYCGIGMCYRIKGDYYKSLDFYQKGLPIIKKHSTLASLVSQYINYSLSCKEMNTKKSVFLGLSILKKGDSILQKNAEIVNDNLFYPLNTNLANLYSEKHFFNYNEARYYYLKNLKRALKKQSKTIISNSYSNLGELYFKQKNDSCLFFFKKSIEYNKENKNSTAESYRNLADYYKLKANYLKALKNINESLMFSLHNNTYKTLSKKKLLNTTGKRNISKALKSKVEILIALFNKTNDREFLTEAVGTVNLADKLVSAILEYSTETDTKYLWREEISSMYALGVETAFLLNEPSRMFRYIEKNKAFLLNQNINDQIKQVSLPYTVTSKDLLYKKKILHLEQSILNNKGKDSLFNLKEKHQTFKDSVSKIHSEYIENKKSAPIITLNKVRNELNENNLVISYSLNNSNLLGLLISKKHIIPFKTGNANEFTHLLKTYKKLISKPLKLKKELTIFKNTSFLLYNKLFPTKKIKDFIKGKNIMIIPDIIFENVPFEALNTNNRDYLTYLIQNTNISYAYSISFLNSNKKINRHIVDIFSGFAPIKFNNNFPDLPFTKNEINSSKKSLKGNFYTHNDASKKNFLSKSSSSKIVHIATHANYSKTPTLYFSKDSLKLHELYTYKSNADLVVLSACETNLGEVKKGEGVLSLARGFFYSGAKSVVSSLWNVNDQSTTSIMTSFYKNLKEGESKSLALTNAKRKYLRNHALSEKSPYYWASFVLIGDTSKTNPPNNNHLFYNLLLIILTSIFFYTLKKRKKRG
jgi:CHAT domain-containing protein